MFTISIGVTAEAMLVKVTISLNKIVEEAKFSAKQHRKT